MKYEIIKGGEKDFEGAPEWATKLLGETCVSKKAFAGDLGGVAMGAYKENPRYWWKLNERNIATIIAERRPITDEAELNECIGQQSQDEFIDDFVTFGKYDRQCKGVVIDVYDVLQAFEVVNPALQHLIKKALCAGLRGHKKREQDLVEILESAKRAIELEGK